MKVLVALVLIGLVGAAVAEELVPISDDYHETVGIPMAARIKAAEEAMDADGNCRVRIVGGSAAKLGQFPYFGGLLIKMQTGPDSVCGSTLLSNTRAVTAAHCWRSTRGSAVQFTVILGSIRLFSGGTRVVTRDVEMHGNYSMATLDNDVAIIRMPPVTYNDNIRNIGLATGTNLFVGASASTAGFGTTADNVPITVKQFLSHVSVQVITNAVCAAAYNPGSILESNLCVSTTGSHGTCVGDSGGPLVVNNQLIGITSFVHPLGCQCGRPAGFARVTSFAPWIQDRL